MGQGHKAHSQELRLLTLYATGKNGSQAEADTTRKEGPLMCGYSLMSLSGPLLYV